MTPTDRAAFLKERQGRIGGSDIAAIFNLPPYGCALKLFREKTGQTPDYPRKETGPMRRGHALERIIAEEYSEKTGRRIEPAKQVFQPDNPRNAPHPDFLIFDESKPGPGSLSVKTCNREIYHKVKREGLQEGYLLQLQDEFLAGGFLWGAYALLWPDGWELVDFDVEADLELMGLIDAEIRAFLACLDRNEMPDRLEASDKRCQRCEYRRSCQGEAMLALMKDESSDVEYDGSLAEIVREYREMKDIEDEAEDLVAEVRTRLEAAIGKRGSIDTVGARVYFNPVETKRWDAAELAVAYEKLRGCTTAILKDLSGRHYDVDSIMNYLVLVDNSGNIPSAETFCKKSVSRPLRVYSR